MNELQKQITMSQAYDLAFRYSLQVEPKSVSFSERVGMTKARAKRIYKDICELKEELAEEK